VDAAREGDVIVVPPGDWRCGPARLGSGLTLRLEKGARLIAPERLEAYLPAERLIRKKRTQTHFFLGAVEAENITVEGEGCIELEGHHFWSDWDGLPWTDDGLERGKDGFFKAKLYKPYPFRPVGLWLENCRNVRISGITLRNSAAYTVWLLGCGDVEIERIAICNDRRGPNTDGLDIDGCRNVRIADCRISGGDDCIALKSDRDLLEDDRPCEHVRISGCTLSSYTCGVRLGFEGDNPIRDVRAQNNVIRDANVGFDLLSVIPANHVFGISRGTPIEDAVMTGCVMRNVRMPVKIWSGTVDPADASAYTGFVRNVRFADMEIDATDACFLGGKAVSDIVLSKLTIRVVRDPRVYLDAKPAKMPTLWGRGYLPEVLTVRGVRDLKLDGVHVTERYSGHGVMDFEKIACARADGAPDWAMYHHEGEGKDCVVLLHGHGSTGMQPLVRKDLKPWLEILGKNRLNVLSPDLRGNAWMCPAAAADLAELIRKGKKEYGWKRVFLISGSMGGTGALIFGILHPELTDGIGALGAATDLARYARWCAAQPLPVHGAIREAIEAHYSEADYPRHSVCRNAGLLTMPLFFAHGGADGIIPVSEARALRDLLGGKARFRYTEIPGGDHDSPLALFGEALAYLLSCGDPGRERRKP